MIPVGSGDEMELLFPVFYLYLVALLHFFYDGPGIKLVIVLIYFVLFFKPNWNKLIIVIMINLTIIDTYRLK